MNLKRQNISLCSQIERRRNSLTTEEFGGVYLGPSSQETEETQAEAAATVLMRRRASLIERKFFSSSAILNFLSESFDAENHANHSRTKSTSIDEESVLGNTDAEGIFSVEIERKSTTSR